MSKGIAKLLVAAALAAGGFGSSALAQGAGPGCVVVKSIAEVEQVVESAGKKTTKLVPLATAVPGTEVIYTTTATNNCKLPAEKIAISNFVPEHMTFVPRSVLSPGADVVYSIDGKTFASADQLTVEENGAARKARAEEYKHFRWVFQSSLQPGASAFTRFRAVLN